MESVTVFNAAIEQGVYSIQNMTVTYPYLMWSLALLGLAALAIVVSPRPLRGAVALSGVFSIPSALASVGFVPVYWNPVRIAEFLVGPEDVIFSFSTGVLSFVMAIWVMRRQARVSFEPRSVVVRLGLCYLAGYVINALFFYIIGMGPMHSALLTIGLLGCGLVILRSELKILSLWGAVLFTVFYAAYTKLGFIVFPGFVDQWNHANLCGLLPFGVPFEEIAWAAFCGAVWPLIAATVMNVRIAVGPQTADAYGSEGARFVADTPVLGERS